MSWEAFSVSGMIILLPLLKNWLCLENYENQPEAANQGIEEQKNLANRGTKENALNSGPYFMGYPYMDSLKYC
jgi:hypothetical protein